MRKFDDLRTFRSPSGYRHQLVAEDATTAVIWLKCDESCYKNECTCRPFYEIWKKYDKTAEFWKTTRSKERVYELTGITI